MADTRAETWWVLWLRSRPAPLPLVAVVVVVVVTDEALGGFRLPEVVGREEGREPPKLLEKRMYLGLVIRVNDDGGSRDAKDIPSIGRGQSNFARSEAPGASPPS